MFTCHSRWVTKVEDMMMKMVPCPFPSLISSVTGCLYFGFFTCHIILTHIRKTYFTFERPTLMFYVTLFLGMKFSHPTFDKVDLIFLQEGQNYNQQWLTSQQPTFYHHLFFFCRILNSIWLFVQYFLLQEPFT